MRSLMRDPSPTLRRAALVLLLPLAVGCRPEPDDLVYVYGRVVDASGAPLADREVALQRQVACPAPDGSTGPARMCVDKEWRTRTDARGRYGFELFVAETGYASQHSDYIPMFELAVPGEGVTRATFFPFTEDLPLQDLPVWGEPPALVTGEGGAMELHHSPPDVPPDPSLPPAGFVVTSGEPGERGEHVLWRVPGSEGPLRLDAMHLEDFPTVVAWFEAESTVQLRKDSVLPQWSGYHQLLRTPPVTLASAGRVPVSRGAWCRAGERTWDTCPLTDGRLERVGLVGPGSAPVEALEVVLSQPRHLRRALLRALEVPACSPVRVEGSADEGASWSVLATLPPLQSAEACGSSAVGTTVVRYEDVPLRAEVAASRVRVRVLPFQASSPAPAQLGSVREVSLFE